ncbi:MAG: sugar phosphate isomerase/epimerase [Balneolaceae bacterium]|nr:sugar phosphate isomerase/epimerase [Balneolaceae bacterium]
MKKTFFIASYQIIFVASLLFFFTGIDFVHAQSSQVESVQFHIPESHQVGGFALGTQSYTFNRYSAFEAIEMTSKAGGRVIELYRQKVWPDADDETRLVPGVSDDVIEAVKTKLAEHDILAVNYGNIPLPNDEEELRNVFDFAQKLGVKAITSEPSEEAMDLIEEMVKEYGIAVAVHNHPPRPDRPDYRHWDPDFVLSLVEGRDPRVGVCADIGHYVRSDIDPVETLKMLEGRIISLHFTDVDQWGAEGEDTVAGTGVIDLPAVLSELKRQNFGGNISIEYENNWNENITDVAQFIGFVRGWAQTTNNN